MSLPLIALLPLAGALLPAWAVRRSRGASAWTAGAVAAAALALLLARAPAIFAGAIAHAAWEWVPALGLRASFRLDGLGFLFAFLILAIGLLVVLYARHYLGAEDAMGRFYAYLLFFMGSMLGIVLAENLILLLVFWELTSLSSFLLIGFWHRKAPGRQGARMALVVTGGGGLALLAGILLLGAIVGSYELSDVLAAGDLIRESPAYLPALVLVLLGAFTKSAQFPFHFWLPHAMAAPTPVSAYLHSATMVKAGVFLLARLHPALAGTPEWFFLVTGAGLATLLVGAYVALLKADLKALLAYSTVSHLGLITTLLGFGAPAAAQVALFHVLNHAAFKAALFMNAGIVGHETGTLDLRRLGGLRRHLPVSAALAALAAAAMAGVPPLNGFLSKEMFLAESVDLPWLHALPWLVPTLATLAAALAVAYALRYVAGVYFGPEASFEHPPHEPPRGMRLPVELLVGVCVAVGLQPALFAGPLVVAAARATLGGAPPEFHPALWHGPNLPLLLSGVGLAAGAALWRAQGRLAALHAGPLPLPEAKRLYDRALDAAVAAARWLTARLENGSLQRYLLLLLASALAALALPLLAAPVAAGTEPRQAADPLALVGWLLLVAGALGTVLHHRKRIVAVVLVGTVGLVVSLAFVHLSAPDLALTQLAVEVVTVVLILLALGLLPRATPAESSPARKLRDGALATAAGAVVGWVSWLLLTRPFESISSFFLAESKPGGGGANVVNVILVDFRGFDTFGEITVLAIAALGVFALIDSLGVPNSFRVAPDDEPRHPLMLAVVARLLLPLALLVAIFLFLRGHQHPGSGFVAGLVVGVALILQYVASGIGWTQIKMPRDFHPLLASGLLLAGLIGIGSFLFAHPFLTGWFDYFILPGIGEFELTSALVFDLGVFFTVVGGVLLVLVHMGKAAEADAIRLPEAGPRGE
jgi:multicomponent K+:H+ antiporter subunit A